MSFQFTIGCDPEIFLRKNGKGFSAHGIIPGDKENPHKTDGGAIQVDGLAAEFNTDPVPLNDFQAFNVNIIKQLRHIRSIVPKELSLSIVPVMDYDQAHMDEQPACAKELGCDPDYNAYTLKKNPRPDADNVLFRSGAGHIHFGWGADIPIDNEEHLAICANFVKMLDATVGLFMTYIDREPRRRELYGKAGAFRPKPYGVEYRTPSNVWITNREYREMVHALCMHAVNRAQQGYDVGQLTAYKETAIREIIDNGDWESAKRILPSLFQYTNQYGSFLALRGKIAKQYGDD